MRSGGHWNERVGNMARISKGIQETEWSGWWANFFDDQWIRAGFGAMDPLQTAAEVDFMQDVLELTDQARILDLCCGIGRHSLELARRGYRVVGVDANAHYLNRARQKAKQEGLAVEFHQQDMREICFRSDFDAVINMWTSFGYFPTERENLKVLEGVRRALVEQGKFLLEVVNRDWVLKNYVSHGWYETDDCFVLEDRHFDLTQSTNISRWIIFEEGKKVKEAECCIRLYSLHEIFALLERVGMEVVGTYGTLLKEEISYDSRLMRIVSRPRAWKK